MRYSRGCLLRGGGSFSWLSSLILLPANDPPALSVAWTLVHEVQFYGVFLLFYLSRRIFVGFLLLWAIAIFCMATVIRYPEPWWRYPLSTLNIEFMFGLMVAYVTARFSMRRHWSLLFVGLGGLVVWLGFIAVRDSVEGGRLILAFGLAIIILGCVYLEQTWRLRWPGLLILMGNASYSIYLIHNPLLSLTQRVFAHIPMDGVSGLTLGVLISLGAGVAYHLYVEQRLLGLFRRASG